MLPFLNTYLLKSRSLISVTIELTDSNPVFHVLNTSFNKGKIHIGTQFSTSNIEAICPEQNKQQLILLNFSGKGIINKKVDNSINYKKNLLFGNNPEDFIFNETYFNKQLYVSIIRKDIIENWITQLKAKKLLVVNISIGPFQIIDLYHSFDLEQIPIVNQTAEIDKNSSLIKLKPENKKIHFKIGEDTIENTQTLNIINVINWISNPDEDLLKIENIQENKEFYCQKKFFVLGSKIGVFFLFLLITIGFLINKNIEDNIQKSQYLLSTKIYTFNQIKTLEQNITNKVAILGNTQLENSSYSKYTYVIGQSIPKEITLELIEINPILKKIRADKKVEIQNNEIYIEGICKNKTAFNNWLIALKKIEWVKKINIIHYDYNAFRILLKQ